MHAPIDDIPGQTDPYGFPGDGREIIPGGLSASQPHSLGTTAKNLAIWSSRKSEYRGATVEPAKEQARRMGKVIHDQLLDTNAVNVFRSYF